MGAFDGLLSKIQKWKSGIAEAESLQKGKVPGKEKKKIRNPGSSDPLKRLNKRLEKYRIEV